VAIGDSAFLRVGDGDGWRPARDGRDGGRRDLDSGVETLGCFDKVLLALDSVNSSSVAAAETGVSFEGRRPSLTGGLKTTTHCR